MTSRRVFSLILIGFIFSLVIFAQDDIRTLRPDKAIERELKGGEAHSYSVSLTKKQFLYVVAEQKGIDVVVAFFAPDGEKLLEVDSPNGNRGGEPFWFLTESEGEYKVEVRSLERNAPAGKYEISIKELRAETENDKFFISAKQLIASGLLSASQRSENSADQAAEKYNEAARISRQIKDKKIQASLILQVGRMFRSLNKSEEAVRYFTEAEKLFEDAGLKSDAAAAFLAAGQSSSSRIEGQSFFKKALLLTREAADKKLEVSALIEIGNTFYNLGDFEQALQHFQNALKICREIDYKDKMAAALDNIGSAYTGQSNFVKALEYHQKALLLEQELGSTRQIPGTLLNIGNVYEGQGNHQQSLEFYQKALTEFEKMRANVGISFATSNIGSVYLNSGEYDKALEYFSKAQQQKSRFLKYDPVSFFNIGLVYNNQGKYSEALEYFQKGLAQSQESGDSFTRADTQISIANIYRKQGNNEKALEFARNALKLSEQYNYPIIYTKALTSLAKTYTALAKKTEARQSLELATAKIESLRSQTTGAENEQQSFFEGMTEPFKMLIGLSVSENNFAEAFSYSERAKARALLDVLQNGRIDFTKAMTVQERQQESLFKNEIASLNIQIANESENSDSNRVAEFRKQLEKKRLEFEDFQTRLYAAHPELRVQRGEMKPVYLAETGALIGDEKTALLEYVVAEDKTFLFVLTKDAKQSQVSLKVYPIEIKQKDLAQRTESFRTKLAKGDLDFGRPAQDLYNLLVKPAAAQLKNKTNLIIVPDGALWDLPFQALQAAQGKYLIENAAVAYAPSLTALREMTKKNTGKQFSDATLLAFGNPTVGKETSERVKQVFMGETLAPLPEAERLVTGLGKLYGARRSKIFTGNEAREETVKIETPKYRIVQFAAHGILNDVSPMYSYIVLAQKQDNPNEDGLLEAWEMKDLDLNADLVILSACETARGKLSSGEGVIGMSWALFIAGAPTTVASQWKVESSSTTELMLEFHRQLLSGKNISKAEALRRASLKLLKTDQYKHPSYWAGFVMVGDGF